MKTKQDIVEEVLGSRLTPQDIHIFSERMIPITQCHDLLKKGKMSLPTALLLRGYAARVESRSVYGKRALFGRPSTVDEASPPAKCNPVYTVTEEDGPMPDIDFIGFSEENAEYRPDQSGLNTMDDPMTKKFKGHIKGYGEAWVLYAKKYKYILPVSRISCKLVTDEGVFSFSDFVEVK